MSPNTNPATYDVVPVEGLPEGLPETQIEEQPVEQPAPKKKTALTRLAGLLLVAVCALPFFLAINYIVGTEAKSATLLAIFSELFASETKLFGILPALAEQTLAALAMYGLILGLALGAIFGLLALITGKKAVLRLGTLFASAAALAYVVSAYLFVEALEVIVLAVFAVAALFYVILSFNKRGKKAWGAIANAICSLIAAVAIVVCNAQFAEEFSAGLAPIGLDAMADTIGLVITVIAVLSAFVAAIRMQTEKARGFALFLVILTLISAIVCALGGMEANYLICWAVAIVLSLIQIIALSKKIKSLKAAVKEVEEVVEETVEEVVEAVEEEFIREEYAEATPYEGGPVEGVALAEEVNPTFTEPETIPEVRTAGYDFYNSKSFDPFIAILNTEERNQFTELFILKYKGVMPEIPDYVVGGDNKEFFRKLFIYLGQYRDRIPDALLAKIYQFAIKIQ